MIQSIYMHYELDRLDDGVWDVAFGESPPERREGWTHWEPFAIAGEDVVWRCCKEDSNNDD